MLKKIVLTIAMGAAIVNIQAQKSPTVLVVNGEKISLDEFDRVYNKNNNSNVEPISKAEYMELYVNFKLKVAEAEALGLDTLPKFEAELGKYVKQLQQPYLIDQTFNEELVVEAYDRLKFDVSASHILIRMPENPTPKDTLEAYSKIKEAYNLIKAGEDFEKVARKYSEDPSVAKNGGYLGYFSAFKMVYPFESAAFNTPVGEVSEPFKTSFGYHILKVDNKREAMGEVQVAHIMIKETPDMSPEQKERAKAKIFEIYNKLESGTDFSSAARNFSEDRASVEKGGVLPWFESGRMVPEFETAAYELDKGMYSKPFQTSYGWHIVMKIDEKGMGTFEEEQEALKQKVDKDGRAAGSQASLIEKLKTQYKVKFYTDAIVPFFNLNGNELTDSDWTAEKAKDMIEPVMRINDKEFNKTKKVYTQYQFAKFLERYLKLNDIFATEPVVERAFAKYCDIELINYEKTVLYAKYPEYRALYDEYHDGILLFDLMNQEVWNKAQEDTVGLEVFYEANKDQFMWESRLDATTYSCASEEVAKQVQEMLNNGDSDSTILAVINADSKLALVTREGKFKKEDQPLFAEIPWVKGVSDIYPQSGRFFVVKIKEVLPEDYKTLNEAKGLVIAKYQEYLENQWVESLRSKYSFEVNWDYIK